MRRTELVKDILSYVPIACAVIVTVVLVRHETRHQPAPVNSAAPVFERSWQKFLRGNERLGSRSARISIIEFSDFQCPYCRAFDEVVDSALRRYPGLLEVVFRNFPLRQLHPYATDAAIAAQCAANQARFDEYRSRLFANGDSLGTLDFANLAAVVGVRDTAKFTRCRKSDEVLSQLRVDSSDGAELQVHGIPTIVINGWRFNGTLTSTRLDSVIRHLAPNQSDHSLAQADVDRDAWPVLTVGTAEGNLNFQFTRIASATRLANGRLVIANGDPLAVRVFDSTGRFLTQLGHQGSGPAEYRGRTAVVPAGGDSVLLFDAGNQRWMLYNASLAFVREWSAAGGAGPSVVALLHHRASIRSMITFGSRCLDAIVDRVPDSSAVLREIFEDRYGRLWSHRLRDTLWSVIDPSGGMLGRVALPVGFQVLDADADHLVGVAPDEDGIQHVVVYHRHFPIAVQRRRCIEAEAPLPTQPAAGAEMRSALRSAWAAAASRGAELGHWVQTTDSLGPIDVPHNTKIEILWAGQVGATIAIFDEDSNAACAVAVGDAIPAGWPVGMILCSA